jgi:hypothetical protein
VMHLGRDKQPQHFERSMSDQITESFIGPGAMM